MTAKIEIKAETTDQEGRAGWNAAFQITDLLDASNKKSAYHREHAESWAKRYDDAIAERKATERIDEVPVTGGIQRTVRFDPGLDAKVALALNKRDTHRAEQKAYDSWVRFFDNARATASSFLLRIQDVRYFFDEDEA